MNTVSERALSKLPEITLGFWIIKILATTLGETGGDAATMSLNLGYWVGTAIFAAVFAAAARRRSAPRDFVPLFFWSVIVATAGTTLADLLDRSLGIGYAGGATILFIGLIAALVIWHRSLGSVSVEHLSSRKAEVFYWVTVMMSQTLGTALGDWMADTTGLGYEGGAIVFGLALAVVTATYFYTRISRTLLFWAAFILTRPLGATLGDLLDKPHSHGGREPSRYTASAVIALLIITSILLVPQRAERQSKLRRGTR